MQTKSAKYILQEDRGTIKRAGRNAIIVTDDSDPAPFEFDSFEETARHIAKRRLKPIEQLRVRTESGEIDTEATESAIQSHYSEYYQGLMDLATDWTVGMEVKRGQAEPMRYDGKLYEVEQTHTAQADWTPDVTPALFRLIPEPSASGYPEWEQPSGAHDAYAKGDRVIHDNPNDGGNIWVYESTYDGNTTEPGRDGTYDRYWIPIERV